MGPRRGGCSSRYLFEKSAYLDPLLSDGSLHARQQRLVLFQFLRFAHEQHEVIQPAIGTPQSGSTDAKHAFLRFVRRPRCMATISSFARCLNGRLISTRYVS